MLKSNIPIANIRVFDKTPTVADLERRFAQFLRGFREQRFVAQQVDRIAEGGPEETFDLSANSLSMQDKMKIVRLAMTYVERQEAATGMQHLSTNERNALRRVQSGATVSRVSTEHDADVLAATLHEDMPWMSPATEHIWHAMRQSVREGRPGFKFAPLLLLGPPGIGKSHWARRLGKLLEVPTTVVEATGEPGSFALVGTQRGWGSAGPGKVIETILREKCANPIMVVDEVEKAGEVSSRKGLRFSLTDALLPLLESMTAKTWQCPYYRVQFDLSWVGWVLTANSLHGLPEPLLSRCPPLNLPPVSKQHLVGFAWRLGRAHDLPDEAIAGIEEIIMSCQRSIGGPSLRTVKRMITRAEIAYTRPLLH
ncbi:Lon protease [Sulfitobacter noctilucae]|uniref:AAA family ATPase n=1 Tax=Sulfitobacter noctilucae TaxID=1342302 RepID=UPI00046A1386|nr:AAA family ATPase [Sulfitobacter noctilucae]KIN75018.1 Lon protease [Sulfitobacter noctilucae]